MRNFSIVSGLALLVSSVSLWAPQPTAAESFQQSQTQFDVFVDESGRKIFVDPYTGEVVRVVSGRNARSQRLERRRKRLQKREERRQRRRARLERELDGLFSERENRNDEYVLRSQNQDDNRGIYLDDPADNNEGKQRSIIRPSLESQAETQVASLPTAEQPTAQSRPDWFKEKPAISGETIAKLQVFLDREGFSPGVIDGSWGSNISKALTAWQEANGDAADLTNPLVLDKYINKPGFVAFDKYMITSADISGPYVAEIPTDYARKAQLDQLSYTSITEMLAERFHMSEAYLRKINPGISFSKPGVNIKIAAPAGKRLRKVHYIVADKGREQLRAYDRNGALVSAYPATIGSAQTPSPSGKVEVARIALDPIYTYNPKVNFQQGSNTKVLTIPPGPNGPVGSVWIALSKPTYGIHGTPNPNTIGKTNSHGCIRLTNWDARELASLIKKGITVEFRE